MPLRAANDAGKGLSKQDAQVVSVKISRLLVPAAGMCLLASGKYWAKARFSEGEYTTHKAHNPRGLLGVFCPRAMCLVCELLAKTLQKCKARYAVRGSFSR